MPGNLDQKPWDQDQEIVLGIIIFVMLLVTQKHDNYYVIPKKLLVRDQNLGIKNGITYEKYTSLQPVTACTVQMKS